MKMIFSDTCFTAIALCLVSILAKSSGELIVLRHPLGDDIYNRELTCVAEDDGSALIWNYDPEPSKLISEKPSLSDFQPGNSLGLHVSACAIWNSTKCIEQWDRYNPATWQTVNSASRPMAPVLDFRWEGFKEFIFYNQTTRHDYPSVGEVGEPSGAAVFSVRGSKGIRVSLCERTQETQRFCCSIILGGGDGKQSAIRACVGGAVRSEQIAGNENCRELAKITHAASDYLDAYEWRTFIIKWNNADRTIKVFRNDDTTPFLKATLSTWVNVPQIFVAGAAPSRIRFHFYEYFLTEQKNVRLYTQRLKTDHKIVRFKLLVGLCLECELSITLEGESESHKIGTWKIHGSGTSVVNDLLAWRSVVLDVNLKNLGSSPPRLVIQTGLTGEGRKGYWAVDSFRMYESRGRMRGSTLSIGRAESGGYEPPWLPAKCQKLSYNGSALVDAFSTAQYRDTSQLQEFLGGRKKPSELGKNWFICDQTGCTCDRGFQGPNCSTPCPDGSYEYNCKGKCESCYSNNCVETSGYCHIGCKFSGFLPPFCKTEFRLAEPTVTDINDTTATIIQELEFGADVANDVAFWITEIGSNTSPHLERLSTTRSQMTYKKVISVLRPNTRYKVQTVVLMPRGQLGEEVRSSEISFSTTCMGKHQFEILLAETNVTVTILPRDKICEDSSARDYWLTVSDAANKTKCNPEMLKFPYTCSQLLPYTEYVIRITSDGQEPWITKFRTNGSVPKKPTILRAFPKSHGILELWWEYSFINEININRFHIYITRNETHLQPIPTTPITMEIDYPVTKGEKNYTRELHLLTSTRYEIAVVAVSQHHVASPESKITVSMPAGIAFASGEELHGTHSGTSIRLEVPEVIKATTNTWVSIVMKDLTGYMQNQSLNSSLFANMTEWLAIEYKVEESQSKYVPIDCNQNGNVNSNCSLKVGGTYMIQVNVTDLYTNATADLPPLTITLIDDEQNLTWLIIFPIIAIPLFLLFMWYRKSKRATNLWSEPSYLDLSLPAFTTTRRRSSTVLCTTNSLPPQPGTAEDRLSAHVYSMPNEPDSRSVSAEYFEEYVKEGSTSGLLYSQFMLLRTGLTKPCEYGRLPENMLKNRYRNLVAYDDSRVILEKIPGEPYSDYINASYITGYKKDKAYIATQGPKPNTVNDFWRMVWQEEVRIICMMTNLIEGNKTTCEKYWPDVGTRMKYGDLHISNTDQQVFADYTFRTFKLSYQLDTRTVRHLHYTGWPSLGVPTYPQSLVAYLKKLEQTPAGNGPVVVHCHTGDGRTGTIILCDICLRRAAAEKVIDVTAVTTRMRDSRANMVGTLQQYVLAHIIIAESMVSMPTQIPCTNSLAKGIKKMRMQLPTDIQRLNDTMWQGQTLQSLTVSRPPAVEGVESDQFPEHEPGTPEVIYDDVSASRSNWVNAVSVDGVKMKNQYLASCLPAPFTLADFWIFVAERKIKLIIILQCSDPSDPTCCDIMPDESVVLRVPDIQVENKTSLDDGDYFTTEKLLLTDTSEENTMTRSLTVLTCKGWGRGKHGKPPKPVTLVSLWRASEKIPRNEGQTLVLCHDGISGCGLYLALSFLLERMAVERECDIVSAIQTVRRSNPEFVQPLEQGEYLYDAAETYAEYFQCYANFT